MVFGGGPAVVVAAVAVPPAGDAGAGVGDGGFEYLDGGGRPGGGQGGDDVGPASGTGVLGGGGQEEVGGVGDGDDGGEGLRRGSCTRQAPEMGSL